MSNVLKPMFAYQGGKTKVSSKIYETITKCHGKDIIFVDVCCGGGKHGEPEAFDWISNARIVECEEKVVTKVEYIFKDIE